MGLLVVWSLTLLNAPAWGQTDPLVTITPTGPVQLVEGGAATTFTISLTSDFLTKLKAQHPEATRSGARLGALLVISRSSTAVTWDTTSPSTHQDRTAEYTLSYNGTELQPRYFFNSSSTPPETTWVYIPLTGSPPGRTSSYVAVDSFAVSAFPLSFTIRAETDTEYFEEEESISVLGRFVLNGNSARPRFSSIRIHTNTLTFDLVEGPLPPQGTGRWS